MMPPGERIIAVFRPSKWSMLLKRWPVTLGVLAMAIVWLWLTRNETGREDWRGAGVVFCSTVVVILIIRRAAGWLSTAYVLTEKRLMRITGVFRRLAIEVPIDMLQNSIVQRLFSERLVGIGSIGFSKIGSERIEVVWWMVASPDQVLGMVNVLRHPIPAGAPRPPVIGLVGGIGSGKSVVAREFERQGCIISDSDAQARAMLNEPDIRSQLTRRWGSVILDDKGQVNRRALADIVFRDDDARKQLESLIHPRLHVRRRALIAQAATGTRAVIVDAPLLFEAGVDAECDGVVYIHADDDTRAERVLQSRNWSRDEWVRREAAQWPLDRKRALSHWVIQNNGAMADLNEQVRRILAEVAGGRVPKRVG